MPHFIPTHSICTLEGDIIMTISEKVAYIQGMFDGMGLDKSESGGVW